jgi:hypothetical protein
MKPFPRHRKSLSSLAASQFACPQIEHTQIKKGPDMDRFIIVHPHGRAPSPPRWLGITAMAALLCAVALAQPNSPTPGKVVSAETILSDPKLWGKDFPLALASLPSWSDGGEREVVIFKDRIIGGTPLKSRDEAEQASKKITAAMAVKELKPKAALQPMFRTVIKATSLKMEVLPRLAEDDSVRLTATRPNAQFFAPELTAAAVQKQLGPPEKIEPQVIQTEGDRRPVILTLYRYANGDITFAESDMTAKPGLIDRVLLNAPKVVNALEAQ